MATIEYDPATPIADTKDKIILSLKSFFASHKEFTWSKIEKSSKIVITDAFPVDKDNTDKYPCIVLQRGTMTWRSGHLSQRTYNNLQERKSGLDILDGDFLCHCVSTAGLEAERIAEEVFLFFTRFRDEISLKGLFDVRGITMMDEQIRKGGSDVELVSVPVRIHVQAEDAWVVIEAGHDLESITVRIKQELS